MIVWLANRTSKTAHLRPDCPHLRNRPTWMPPPLDIEAVPHPTWPREWVQAHGLLIQGAVRFRDLHLCMDCGR
jgi:hypothetical protein